MSKCNWTLAVFGIVSFNFIAFWAFNQMNMYNSWGIILVLPHIVLTILGALLYFAVGEEKEQFKSNYLDERRDE